MELFDPEETAFTKTAATLQNSSNTQGVSFSTWGIPDRLKINAALAALNEAAGAIRGV